jgi:hypothetical protein
MERRFVAPLITLLLIGSFTYTVLYNPSASASVKEVNVISRTKGDEVLTAELLNDQLKISLKNNHKDTITAFAISFTDTKIKEDFAYSEVHFGIEPGETFQKSYPVSLSPVGPELPPLYLLTVLLKNGAGDGSSKVAQEIEDVRLGNKIQILRTLRILEKEGQSRKDPKIIKSDIVAALNAGEFETRIILNELQLSSPSDSKLSDDLRNGLQWGREKMLRRFEVVEQLPAEERQKAIMELKERSRKLFAKL